MSRFRFALRDGPVLAWGVTFVVCLFAPGSWADRAFAFGVVTVLLMISVFVRYARRNKRGGAAAGEFGSNGATGPRASAAGEVDPGACAIRDVRVGAVPAMSLCLWD